MVGVEYIGTERNEMSPTDDTCLSCKRQEAKISPVMVMSVENRGILNACSCILKLYQLEHSKKHEERLRQMIHLLPEMRSHYRKKEELFLPLFEDLGRDGEKEKEKDRQVLNGIDRVLGLEKEKSPYDFETELLDVCQNSLILAKEENTDFLITCYHNLTLDEMDSIGRRIPSYGYTFLSVKPKPEDLISRIIEE